MITITMSVQYVAHQQLTEAFAQELALRLT